MYLLHYLFEGKIGKVIERHVSTNGMIPAQSEVPRTNRDIPTIKGTPYK